MQNEVASVMLAGRSGGHMCMGRLLFHINIYMLRNLQIQVKREGELSRRSCMMCWFAIRGSTVSTVQQPCCNTAKEKNAGNNAPACNTRNTENGQRYILSGCQSLHRFATRFTTTCTTQAVHRFHNATQCISMNIYIYIYKMFCWYNKLLNPIESIMLKWYDFDVMRWISIALRAT
jgi:hypothetical protein